MRCSNRRVQPSLSYSAAIVRCGTAEQTEHSRDRDSLRRAAKFARKDQERNAQATPKRGTAKCRWQEGRQVPNWMQDGPDPGCSTFSTLFRRIRLVGRIAILAVLRR